MPVKLEDVAREAGVSVVTVSRVLNNRYPEKVSEKTRQRVLEAVERLNYRPNINARGLLKGKTNLIGVFIYRIENSFFGDILQGIQDAAMEAGFSLLVYTNESSQEQDKRILTELRARQVDGIIYTPSPWPENVLEVIEAGVPVVQLGFAHNQVRAPYVAVDHIQGAYMATKHLIQLGHTRIAHLAASRYDTHGLNRLLGYQMALRNHGLKVDEELIIEGNYTWMDGYTGAKKILATAKDVTAVFACSDYAAVGAMRAFKEAGIRVPDDIAIVGYDDLSFSAWLPVSLTTVAQPKQEIGQAAVQSLLALMEGENVSNTTFYPELIVRESCGAKQQEKAHVVTKE